MSESTALAIRSGEMTREQVELLKRTIAKGTTDDEFALFMNTSKRLGLDPFARQVFAVKRWDNDKRDYVMTTQVSIDGFRLVAARTGEDNGQDGPYWCGPDGVWVDVWTSNDPPVAAQVTVFRKGREKPYRGVVRFKAYCQTKKDGGLNSMWSKMGAEQLAKCAEAQALRKGFPELSGVYIPEEMARMPRKKPDDAEAQAVDAEIVEERKVESGPSPADDGFNVDDVLKAFANTKNAQELVAVGSMLGKVPDKHKAMLKAAYRGRMAAHEAAAKAADDSDEAMAERDAE